MAALLWFVTGASAAGLVAALPSGATIAETGNSSRHAGAQGAQQPDKRKLPSAQEPGKPVSQRQGESSPPADRLDGFDVEIVSPRPTQDIAGRVRVRAEVAADQPSAVSAVDFFIDGRLMFSDAEAPYELLWNAGRPAQHRIEVRAYGPGRQVATDALETGLRGGESVLGGFSARVERVELHARIEEEERIEGPLDTGMFQVFENDVLQPVVAVERVVDLPLAVGLLIDHSGSMLSQLDTALDAAAAFVDGLLTHPDDKAFVLGFADVPIVFQEFTNDAVRLADSISLIEDGRHTAMYDAIVSASKRFAGIDGRRAVILLTDGADEGSDNDFREAIAAAQRADVALYPVAVELAPRHARERWILQRLAEETGGRLFSLGRRSDPTSIYEAIQDDLRAQYRISYSPLVAGGLGEWRELQIRLRGNEDGKLKVRSRPGYFAQ
jgi:VWFA-related protein